MRIALAGNPNSGKTTMFNLLTGRNERVGNWAGVTVDKKECKIKSSYYNGELTVIDLPGAYSISPFTSEESVTRDTILSEDIDVIINIVDATNISRGLFFTTQLLELGIPVVVALNKSDVNDRKATEIDSRLLEEKLGCRVVKTVSTDKEGIEELVKTVVSVIGTRQQPPFVQPNINSGSDDLAKIADKKRYEFINSVVSEVENRAVHTNDFTLQDKFDTIITNKWVGIPIFAVVMFLVFYISQSTLGTWIAGGIEFESGLVIPGLATYLGFFQEWVGSLFANASPLLYSLLIDGVIGGVIAVVEFLPLVMVMYFLISLLEDCGYMARVSVVLDPIFKKVGLSGKSVIPFVVGTGCSVPGIMACRTIRNERERRTAALLTPFMPCGAKLPVIALFAGAFFGDSMWVGPIMYFVGIIIIFISALLINAITGNRHKKSYFIIELPEYKMPSLLRATQSMCSRGWAYIVKAGTVILVCNTVIHIMQTFTWNFTEATSADSSILAGIATPFAYLLIPIVGVTSWQLAAATITGFIAKENIVGTLAVCYVGLQNLIDAEQLALMEGAGTEVAGAFAITKVAALAYLMLNLFIPPCFAAIGAMNSELKSTKWLFGAIGFQIGIGYTVAYFVYTIGTLFTAPETLNIVPVSCGFCAVLVFGAILAFIITANDRKNKKAIKNG